MLKVLIAEDDILLADMLAVFLELAGYTVVGAARTVAEAVLLADLHKPDLAVLDYRLARGEFGPQIRPLLHDKLNLGILYVSGDALDKILSKADGDAYIQKPYGLEDLSQALTIVREIKATGQASASAFRRGFHLLEDRRAA